MTHPFLAFFSARSSILGYFEDPINPVNQWRILTSCSVLCISLGLFLIEGFTPDSSPPLPPHSNIKVGTCLLSRLTFYYMNPFMIHSKIPSSENPISAADLPDLSTEEGAAHNLLEFRKTVATFNTGQSKKKSLAWMVLWHFKFEILQTQIWSAMQAITTTSAPLIMGKLLHELARRANGYLDVPTHTLMLYAVGIFCCQWLSAIFINQASHIGSAVESKLTSIFVSEVSSKVQQRKSSPKGQGQIINFVSVEATQIGHAVGFLYIVWPWQPLTAALALGFLFNILGWSTIAGVAFLGLVSLLQGHLSKRLHYFQKKTQIASDSRLELVTGLMASIRLLKFYAWELNFLHKLETVRQEELNAIWEKSKVQILQATTVAATPALTAVSVVKVNWIGTQKSDRSLWFA